MEVSPPSIIKIEHLDSESYMMLFTHSTLGPHVIKSLFNGIVRIRHPNIHFLLSPYTDVQCILGHCFDEKKK